MVDRPTNRITVRPGFNGSTPRRRGVDHERRPAADLAARARAGYQIRVEGVLLQSPDEKRVPLLIDATGCSSCAKSRSGTLQDRQRLLIEGISTGRTSRGHCGNPCSSRVRLAGFARAVPAGTTHAEGRTCMGPNRRQDQFLVSLENERCFDLWTRTGACACTCDTPNPRRCRHWAPDRCTRRLPGRLE